MTQGIPYSVSLDLAGSITAQPDFETVIRESEKALAWLKARYADGGLELLRVPERRDDIEAARAAADRWNANTSDVAVLGIGGSSLGGKAIADLIPFAAVRKPRVTFFDNADPFTFKTALAAFDLRTTRFIAISKSGTTAETLAQTLAAAGAIEAAGGG